MIEPEIAFADLQDDMALAEGYDQICRCAMCLRQCPEEMKFFNDFYDKGLIERLQHLIAADFGHITYTEAIEMLEKHQRCNLNIRSIGDAICRPNTSGI